MKLTMQDVTAHATGRRYQDVFTSYPKAVEALLLIMSDSKTNQRLTDAEQIHHRPALAGVVPMIEADAAIRPALASLRFRQLVGVIVLIAMERLGWVTVGKKGSITATAKRFQVAEHYRPRG